MIYSGKLFCIQWLEHCCADEEAIANTLQEEAVSQYIQEYVIENSKVNSIPKNILKHLENSIIYEIQSLATQNGMEFNDFLKHI